MTLKLGGKDIDPLPLQWRWSLDQHFKEIFLFCFAIFEIDLPVKASPLSGGVFYHRIYLCVNISEGGDTFAALKRWQMGPMWKSCQKEH